MEQKVKLAPIGLAAVSLFGAALTHDLPSLALCIVAVLLALAGVLRFLVRWRWPADPWDNARRWRRRATGAGSP